MTSFVFAFVANGIGLYLAGKFIPGFSFPLSAWEPFLIATGIFTLITVVLKPLVKFLLFPLIFLTLGIASFFINAGMLMLLDHLLDSVTITGLFPLFCATLLLSVIHMLFHISPGSK